METSGSIAVSPAITKSYGLGCSGPGGEIVQSVTVTVPEPADGAAAGAVLAALCALCRLATRPRIEH